MAREPEELVEMRRVLGAQLAAFRQAAQLSQGQLAIPAAVDRTTVNHIEKGRSRGDERFWRIADDKCHADGALLAGFHAWQAAKQDHDVRTRETQLTEARAKADALRATAVSQLLRQTDRLIVPGGPEAAARSATPADTEQAQGVAGALAPLALVGSLAGDMSAVVPNEVLGQLARLLCEWIGAMNRRELFELLGWTTSTIVTSLVVSSLDTDEQERLARAVISPSRVDEKVINHIETILRYCKHLEDTLGSRAVLNTVFAQRNLVHDLLAECPAALKSRLLSVYSDMSSSIGFYFFELNDFDSSWCYYDQARAAAHDAGNIELGIHALGNMSYTMSWQGKTHVGIDLAAAAQNLVDKSEDPLMRVCVAQRAATVHAFDGQYKACMIEFDKAQDSLASIGEVSAESPAYFYDEGFLASKKSECMLQLGKPEEAAASANAGLALYDKSSVRNLAFCTLRLGNAYLQSEEIDEAARVISSAADLTAQTRTARLVKELRITRTRMYSWQETPAVKRLDDQLAAYGLLSGSFT